MGSKLKIYLTKFHENILAFSIIKNFKTQKFLEALRIHLHQTYLKTLPIELIERFSMKAENLTSAVHDGLKMFIKLIARENFERKKII